MGTNSEIDQEMLQKFLQMDDERLGQMLTQIALAAGMDSARASRATQDMDRLRNKMSRMTDADLKRVSEMLGEDTIKQIANAARKS